jgi:hypothetical protein
MVHMNMELKVVELMFFQIILFKNMSLVLTKVLKWEADIQEYGLKIFTLTTIILNPQIKKKKLS